MPAGTLQTRRYLSIQDGRMKELVNGSVVEHNVLFDMHLVAVSYREVIKDNVKVGDVIRLHLVDECDYFVLDTWVNSQYAKCFYQVMQNLDLNRRFTLSTSQTIKDGKKKPALFVSQDGANLKWCYTRDNMQDCPPLEEKIGPGGKIIYDDTLQMMFFSTLVNNWLMPELRRKPNPFPTHSVYRPNETAAEIAASAPPASSEDDLPF